MTPSSWWLPWLPILGSVVVAGVAFVGVVINNATNREAIRSTRVLDHHKWLRETLLQLGCDAAGHAFEIDRLYNKRSFATAEDRFTEHMFLVAGEIRKLSATADSLSILGFPELAAKCAEVRSAADRIVDPAQQHRDSMRTPDCPEQVAQTRAAVDRELAALAQVREEFVACAEFTLKTHVLSHIDPA